MVFGKSFYIITRTANSGSGNECRKWNQKNSRMDRQTTYRPGAIGAMTDEYERALADLKRRIAGLSDEAFTAVRRHDVPVEFQSVRGIVGHVVSSGYAYADYIRRRFGEREIAPEYSVHRPVDGEAALDAMFAYTVETFAGKWAMTDAELLHTLIKTSWSAYDLEALIEHAIVHVLRHRLQIEKLLEYGGAGI